MCHNITTDIKGCRKTDNLYYFTLNFGFEVENSKHPVSRAKKGFLKCHFYTASAFGETSIVKKNAPKET